MAVEVKEEQAGKILHIQMQGKVTKEDYEKFVPEIERCIKDNGKVRLVVSLHDFHGWEASALWEDIKFDVKHFSDLERLAIVGETKWEQGMALFCTPFTTASIKYFDHTKMAEAEEWINE